VRWLREQGLDAASFRTEFGAEGGDLPATAAPPAEPSSILATDAT